LLQRLKTAGAETRLWRTQFGFKSKHGTADALFLARRLLEDTWAKNGGQLVLLALDWAKAFDSVSPDSLLTALDRFGVPAKFAAVVKAIYTDRTFNVRDADRFSEKQVQHFGICQGCPLSPFLFAIVMTVLLTDARRNLGEEAGTTSELVYADDTLIVASQARDAAEYMLHISTAGAHYGLQYNWKKLEVLPVRCEADIRKPDGSQIDQKDCITYLGSVLAQDGRAGPELARRLGAARAEFKTLARVWSHSSLARRKKLQIFDACVLSKLLYCMHTTWLQKAELAKLDAFQAKCLRKIMGIQHSFYSRVSNEAVLEEAGAHRISTLLLKRQLVLLGQIARKHSPDPVRDAVFEPGSYCLRRCTEKRRRGRPRCTWAAEVWKHAQHMAGDMETLHELLGGSAAAVLEWKKKAHDYCARLINDDAD